MSYPHADREDQVPRLKAFQAAHPEITITNPIDSRSGVWSARRAGEVMATELDLGRLLDRLERLLEPG